MPVYAGSAYSSWNRFWAAPLHPVKKQRSRFLKIKNKIQIASWVVVFLLSYLAIAIYAFTMGTIKIKNRILLGYEKFFISFIEWEQIERTLTMTS